jgi:hypothetical protein
VVRHPEATNLITSIVKTGPIAVYIHTTFSAFTICIQIGAACQLTHITRFFYYPRNQAAKQLFYGLPLTAVISMHKNNRLDLTHWFHILPITIVPALCVFTHSFRFTATLLPEFGDVCMRIVAMLKNGFDIRPAPITRDQCLTILFAHIRAVHYPYLA